jgi:hypothetical protein
MARYLHGFCFVAASVLWWRSLNVPERWLRFGSVCVRQSAFHGFFVVSGIVDNEPFLRRFRNKVLHPRTAAADIAAFSHKDGVGPSPQVGWGQTERMLYHSGFHALLLVCPHTLLALEVWYLKGNVPLRLEGRKSNGTDISYPNPLRC